MESLKGNHCGFDFCDDSGNVPDEYDSVGKREITGRRYHSVSPNNNRTVMQRRIMFEYINQKLAGNQ